MKVECFDEGTIQAFLDGELDNVRVEQLSRHIAVCDDCAVAIADAEQELAAAFSVLDREFDTLVPTRRLWTKINRSIEADGRRRSLLETVLAFLTNPTAVAFASLLIVFGLFLGLYGLRTSDNPRPENQIAKNGAGNVSSTPGNKPPVTDVVSTAEIPSSNPGSAAPDQRNEYRKIGADDRTGSQRRVQIIRRAEKALATEEAFYDPLAGEETYIRTIETLERSVDQRKDAAMGPSARFAFEKDIAVASSVIERLKDEVRRDPTNQTARELLRTTYQNKISLLNSVAEKSELMASLN